jgi:dipeptide/tripeptide permease
MHTGAKEMIKFNKRTAFILAVINIIIATVFIYIQDFKNINDYINIICMHIAIGTVLLAYCLADVKL